MVSGIGGIGMQGMQRPDPKEMFGKVDTDGSGGVSQTELQTLLEKMQEASGKTSEVSADDFSSYDSDGDGSLNEDELKSVLQNSGFGPPKEMEGMAPPSPPQEQASAAYSANSGQDELSTLIDNLKSLLEELTAAADDSDSSSSSASSATKTDNLFSRVDNDQSGGISQDELKTLASNLEKMTGQSLDVSDDAFAGYDSDGDGVLSADELKGAMDKNGFQPPPPRGGMVAGAGGGEQDAQYSPGSLQEQLTQLKSLLQTLAQYTGTSGDSGDGTSSLLSITS